MYVSAADNDYGVTGAAFGGSIPGLVQQSAGTLDLYADQGQRL